MSDTSVVINDRNLFRAFRRPEEANPELVVDTDAVLPFAISFQCFQPITRRRSQEVQGMRDIQLRELSHRYLCDP